MSIISNVIDTTRYEAVQAHEEGAAEVIMGWLKPTMPEGQTVDLSGLIEGCLWVLRDGEGNLTIVHAADFLRKYETTDEEAATTPELTEEEIQKFTDSFRG